MKRLALITIAALALAACAKAPKPRIDEVAEEVPADWAATSSNRAIDHAWIDRFNDTTLESLVDDVASKLAPGDD